MTRYGEVPAFVQAVLATSADDCVEWPYVLDRHGYPKMKQGGRYVSVPRHVLTLTVGPPPGPGYHAAHAPVVCHNRRCINPAHLRWATPAENVADQFADGRPRKPPPLPCPLSPDGLSCRAAPGHRGDHWQMVTTGGIHAEHWGSVA